SFGEQVETGLDLAHEAALHDAATRVRTLYERRLAELDAHLLDAQKLFIDVTNARRAQALEARTPGSNREEPPAHFRITPDHEHTIWPFDGEFWRDELGSYRQVVISACGR